ncbi:MAG: class I SAM-dependent methyltransferase [Kiritimatiellia bacterium]
MQAQFDPDSAAAWQVRLFKKSLTKQAKLENLQRFLSPTEGKSCLDVGGDNGVIPFMLRRNGGQWISVDSSPKAVASMRDLFGEHAVYQIEGAILPFEDDSFDTIVVIDYLEHIRDDAEFLKECHRCLRPRGELLINVPHIKSFSLNRGLRQLLKLTDEKHGHVRPGYRLRDLYEISKNGYDIVESQTYAGFFVEFIDTWIQFAGGGLTQSSEQSGDAKGLVLDQQDLRRFAKAFRIYSLLYPFLLLARLLDHIFVFTNNHYLVIKARPRPWIERKQVTMRDGRSIADATINTRIGTAANLTDPKNNRSSAT